MDRAATASHAIRPARELEKEERYHLIGNKMLHRSDGRIRLDTKWKMELAPEEADRMLLLTRSLSQAFGY